MPRGLRAARDSGVCGVGDRERRSVLTRDWLFDSGGGFGVVEIVGFVDTRFVVICFDMRKSR